MEMQIANVKKLNSIKKDNTSVHCYSNVSPKAIKLGIFHLLIHNL